MSVLEWLFGAAGDVPRGYCLNWRPDLMALHASSDAMLAVSYFALPLGMIIPNVLLDPALERLSSGTYHGFSAIGAAYL